MKNIEFFLIILTTLIIFSQEQPYPVVLMHGIGANASTMNKVVEWIHELVGPDVYVKNVEIGNGYWDSMFNKMFDMVTDFCNQLKEDQELSKYPKINLIGYSQGSLITRGYVEYCNDPPVHNFITWSGPHEGVFGIPYVDWNWLDKLLREDCYIEEVQNSITFAQYWKDTLNYDVYLNKSIFLPYLNNEEKTKDPKIKQKIQSLNSFTLLMSTVDEVVNPKESAWFAFYDDKRENIIPYNQTLAYKEDWLGLRYLDENNRLNFYKTDCRHQDYPTDKCKDVFIEYTLPRLLN
ncbi:palmitoyl-protein thioesterase 1 [Anaeramoeba ignava]|uniref:Palmitoyl-protein thioesterase 1 n=1 Tax=Anaeramoeba ignava TaxID=1746090 RepID=A0A9Q0LGS5_ANAIG|nr:palmitoyl-protein thioesterase 1 [Anaeramoeba ignava]|eukprot:Anaeramoba_ignava/c16989_g2_i1.p1 GENE.c16989_g2_i1~~c16989_g2_i1.p1  ORF type:complete len:292 (+),score=88.09 c16989_g2_i1:11-886(+)